MQLDFEYVPSIDEMRKHIAACEDGSRNHRHIQQVSYSTFHEALTQVCFSCRKVRSSMMILQGQ